MAQHARRLVQQNGFQDVITVLEGYMEKQTLPEPVDIIISEWMGYFLLRESMFDSVIAARAKHLKPGGALYPSHAQLYMAPIASNIFDTRSDEFATELAKLAAPPEQTRTGAGVPGMTYEVDGPENGAAPGPWAPCRTAPDQGAPRSQAGPRWRSLGYQSRRADFDIKKLFSGSHVVQKCLTSLGEIAG